MGFLKLVHQCLDPVCAGITAYVPQYRHYYPCNISPYFPPADTLYDVLVASADWESATLWLTNRLMGAESGLQKIAFDGNTWMAWDGVVWAVEHAIANLIANYLSCYLRRIADVLVPGEEGDDVTNWTLRNKEAIEKWAKWIDVSTVGRCLRQELFQVPIYTFDGVSSRGYLCIQSQYLNLQSGRFEAPHPGKFISQSVSTPWSGGPLTEEDELDEDGVLLLFMRSILEPRSPEEIRQVIDTLSKFFGYALTGECNLDVILQIWGMGRNAKGIVMRAISACLGFDPGDFAAAATATAATCANSDIRRMLHYRSLEQR